MNSHTRIIVVSRSNVNKTPSLTDTYDHNATTAIGLTLVGDREEEEDRNEIHFHSRRSSLPFRVRRFGIAGGPEAGGSEGAGEETGFIQATKDKGRKKE